MGRAGRGGWTADLWQPMPLPHSWGQPRGLQGQWAVAHSLTTLMPKHLPQHCSAGFPSPWAPPSLHPHDSPPPPHDPFCSVVNAVSCPGDRRTMLVNVAEGVLVFCATLGAGGSGNADRQRALVILPYLLLQRSPTPPRGYFCPGGSTVVCA